MGKSERLLPPEHTIDRCGFGPLGGCQYILLCIISTILYSCKSSNMLCVGVSNIMYSTLYDQQTLCTFMYCVV